MKKKYYRGNNESPEINLTPLIDVVFVILIMFIVIAPILELDQIFLANSSKEISHENFNKNHQTHFKISVKHDDTIWYNNAMLSIAQLRNILKQDIKQYGSQKIQLIYDKRASFGTYQEIKNLAEELQFNEIDVLLKPC